MVFVLACRQLTGGSEAYSDPISLEPVGDLRNPVENALFFKVAADNECLPERRVFSVPKKFADTERNDLKI